MEKCCFEKTSVHAKHPSNSNIYIHIYIHTSDNKVTCFKRPVNSPDFNPTESHWAIFGSTLRNVHCTTKKKTSSTIKHLGSMIHKLKKLLKMTCELSA